MSLLLDALRRAEQEKRARQETGGPAGAAPAAPEASRADTPAPARAGALELEMVPEVAPAPVAPLAATAPGVSASPPVAAAPARAAAKTVFTAKQATGAASASRRNLLLAGLALVSIAVAGGGYYVWRQVNALSPKSPLVRVAPRPVTPAPPAEALAQGAPATAAVPAATGAEPRRSPPPTAEQLVADLVREAASAPPAPPLRLTRSFESPKVLREVATGYERLRGGDLAGARSAYGAAIALEPANVDAQLGLATVAARSGDRALAQRHYRRVLELDPRNPTAAAGLVAISEAASGPALESALRADLDRDPRNAALQFTLGNLLASQGRWTEAQGAYFEAHRLDPANPDILHNLAVSLDNLGQARLAADYYRRALAASRDRPHQFDPRPAELRLAELAR